MSYLERNSRLINEVGDNLRLQPGQERGEGHSMRFSSAGSYRSGELSREIYVGLKEPKENDEAFGGELLKQRFVFELAVMSVVSENMPHLLPELPLFYGLLTDQDGKPIAIVTEDFSRNGQDHISPHAIEPDGFRDLFIEDTLDDDFVSNIGLTVHAKAEEESDANRESSTGTTLNRGTRKLADFYPLVPFNKRGVHRAHFPEEEVEKQLDRHSLKVDYVNKKKA